MEKLKIIDKKVYMQTKDFLDQLGIELEEREYIANANFCSIVSEYCNNKISATKILEIYDYVTDVLQGQYPKLIIQVPKADRILWAKKIIKKSDKLGLTDEEIEFFAFCIVYSFFVYGMNEETQEPEQAIFELTSKEITIKQYEYAKKENLWKFEVKRYSDTSKNDYGFTMENPIEVTSVSMEYSYLGAIITTDGKEITYNRIGSFLGKDNIFVDGYEIFTKDLFGKKKVSTLYITGDGCEDSQTAPKGFKFKK
ncbi:MAG TPA: hypothetical protein VJ916_00155 [Anaerovoracaceae bacterium]|nr:hypothetical protein [Anaerovoracaceae bacterium]